MLAIAYTIKNEIEMIVDNINIHKKLGCRRFYVYLDGTTDGSPELLKRIPEVECRPSVTIEDLQDPPGWAKEIAPYADVNMDVRKRLNTIHAISCAEKEGIEWLICIDPDEVVVLLDEDAEATSPIDSFLRSLPPSVDQVLFRNWDLIPPVGGATEPFKDGCVFLRRFPYTEAIWRFFNMRLRSLCDSKVVSVFDYWFYRLRFMGALNRRFEDPVDRTTFYGGYFLSYANFKCAVRVAEARHFHFAVHYWGKDFRKPKNLLAGQILHYDLPNEQYFLKKFQQRAESMLVPTFYVRYRLALIARHAAPQGVRSFFNKYICQEGRVEGLLKRRIAVKVTAISRLVEMSRRDPSERNSTS